MLTPSSTTDGFTESAFVTAMKIFRPGDQRKDHSLGRPLRNVKCYILNQSLQKVPLGAIGELWIGGQGVSTGYLNRPELTRERFLVNPFQSPGEKSRGENSVIYKTGDLARWIPGAAEVEYLGRNDFQLKLRGIRIEPGEIESVLASYPGVERAVVVAKIAVQNESHPELGSKHLVGYFTGNDIREEELLHFLESKLPRYMVPTRLLRLDRIPTTINGKVDFRALPEINLTRLNVSRVAPRNEDEEKLAQIWGLVLQLDANALSINDNFFYKGGHSITCIQLVGRVREQYNVQISHEEVFAVKTLAKLAELIRDKKQVDPDFANGATASKEQIVIPQRLKSPNVEAVYLANSLQQGFMYHYLKQGSGDSSAYVMHNVYRYRVQIDSALYRVAWELAKDRFASLRLRFVSEEAVYQIVDKQQALDWRQFDVDGDQPQSLDDTLSNLQAGDMKEEYKLEQGRLFRIYFVRGSNEETAVLISAHHAILDGWALPILIAFVQDTYLELKAGFQVSIQPDISFHDCQTYIQNNRTQNIEYWERRVGEVEERCDLKGLIRDECRYKVNLTTYDRIQRQKEQTVKLGQWASSPLASSCSQEAITLHSVLQFIWHKILAVYGNGRQTVTGTIVSGRNLPVQDVDSAVGLFINTLPLVVDHKAQAELTILDAIKTIQLDVITMNSRSNVELGKLRNGELTHQLFDSLFVLENYPIPDKNKTKRQSRVRLFGALPTLSNVP